MLCTFFAFPLLLVCGSSSLAADAAHQHIDPARVDAQLLKVQSNYAIWMVPELIARTAGHEVRGFIFRFYRQKLDQPMADLIFEYADTRWSYPVAIRDDGSTLLMTGDKIHLIPSSGPAFELDFAPMTCLIMYPDGFLVWMAPYARQSQPTYFVPFDGKQLQPGDRILVDDESSRAYCWNPNGGRTAPHRSKDLLLWIADSKLHAFNLKTRERTEIKLAKTTYPISTVKDFDGSTVLCDGCAFDAKTGEILGESDFPKQPMNVRIAFAIHDRIGYYFDTIPPSEKPEHGSLRAVDLTSIDGTNVPFCDFKPLSAERTDDGLMTWDGKRWKLIPWLKDSRWSPHADPSAFLKGYRISHYLNAAVEMQKLDPEHRTASLRELAIDPQHASEMYPLCRMLFDAKDKGEFRGALRRYPGTLGDWHYTDRPLEPITLWDDIPILVVTEYNDEPNTRPENPLDYVNYCLENCKWRDVKFAASDAAHIKQVVEAFIAAHPEVGRDAAFVREQAQ